jgi:hypothetical protein
MKKLTTLVLGLGLVATSFGQARLQVIHNSPSPTVDIYVDDALALDNVAFRTASGFLDIPSGVPVSIDVAPETSASSAESIYNITATFNDGESYVGIASGIVGDAVTPFEILVQGGIREAALGSGVDFIGHHGSTDAPTVDIVARDVALLLDDVSYRDISGYLNVPAGAYTLDVYPGDDNFNVVASFAADLSGLDGGSAVVFASGFLAGTPEAFGLFAALADGTVVEFPGVPQETTNLQVIHNSPSPTVDVYLNDALIVDNFAFRTATPFVSVPASIPVKIDIAPETSSSSAEAIATFSGTFRADREYVGIASGIVGDASTPFDIVFQGNIRQTNPFGEVQLIAFHGSTDAPEVDVEVDGAGLILFDDLEYSEISRYIQVAAADYDLNINTSDGLTTVITFDVDLTGLAGQNAVVFASGFLAGTPEAFGLYAALNDGTVVAFPVSMMREANAELIGAFPSRVKDFVNIQITSAVNQETEILLFDATGKLMMSQQIGLTEGTQTTQIDMTNLAPGSYFATLASSEGVQTTQIVKVN